MMIWMIWEVFGEGISHNYALHLKQDAAHEPECSHVC